MRTLDTNRKDQVTVEAESVEEALAEISAEFGANAEIMRAQKVHRGGVGGFFAKEMVQLTARRRRQSAPVTPSLPSAPPAPHAPETGGGIADVLERMAQDADAEDSDFRTVLQRELGSTDPNNDSLAVAAGWEPPADAETATPDVSREETLLAALTEAEPADEALPEPVAVGPALIVEPSAVVDRQEVEIIEPLDQPEVQETVAEVVIPLPVPAEPDFEEAASTPDIEDEPETVAPEAITEDTQEPAADVEEEVAPVAEEADWWRTAETLDAPEGMGSVSWSTTALLRLGLPAPVIAAVADLDSNDDLGWIDAIAAAVAPYCGQLSDGDVVIVGPHAERLAEPLGLPLVRSGDMAPYNGSFCAMVDDDPQDRQWLEYVQGGRGIHLVVGDEPWHDLLIDEPVAVSWVGESAVVDALYLAFTLGATLGFGTVDGFVSSMVRPQPTDVALAIRRIVGRR